MADVRLVTVNTPDIITYDWLQTPTGLLDETEQLASAIVVALNTDALAAPSDVLPDPRSTDRRGWWGDYQADVIWRGWPIGSLLWLLTRAKIVDQLSREGATIVRVQTYIKAALQPFIKAKLCSQITVVATQLSPQRISARIMIYRGPKTSIQLDYEPVWTELFPDF